MCHHKTNTYTQSTSAIADAQPHLRNCGGLGRRERLGAKKGVTSESWQYTNKNEGKRPLGHSLYYLGQLPNLDLAFPPSQTSDELGRRKLLHHLAADWHLASIRLAGRIFGCLQREMAVRRDGYFGNPNDGFHPSDTEILPDKV
ncbi:hypothetical protein R3P38DRAFT_2794615 [Favolaschia claudopus]|uniref:Uncharacterized protein n=1 Tax=Favolaschia claudopus TaxID=2862362 RepID=A0AAW0A9I9_9AGAR